MTPPPAVLRAIFAQAKKSTGPIPVRGTLVRALKPGAPPARFQQTLMRYAGAWRHCSNGPMLKAAGGFGVGERVKKML